MNGRIAGLVGGLLGVAASSAAVAGLVRARRGGEDPYAGEPLGELVPSRSSTVAADDGVALAVEEVDPERGGRPELTVVLVHGFALSRRSWHFQRKQLAKLTGPRVRQVLYDHRSHGRSARAIPGSARISQLARDLDAVIRAVAPDGPLVLVGHSMGGMTIMELARIHPELFAERVRGVALLATSAGDVGAHGLPRSALSPRNPVPKGVGRLADWQPGFVELVRTAGDGVTRRLTRRLSFGPGEVSPALVRFMTDMLAVTGVAELTEFLNTLGQHNRYAALAGLKHSSVLVLSGDADRLLPFEHAERIAAELPDAELVRAPGAGHMVPLEQPDLVNACLIGLLQRCAGKETA
ncbi:alpha/beta fold hydrolase [Sciscionella sediminilitoris]|uniref:alpha/beta fold hydrolase n=1 Tax=Sciscionella sediminilitoris TaxID=1445613 RepID=UPI0004DED08B|nr:alpha/beta hydrolase [Sciscionella sp. SE31]